MPEYAAQSAACNRRGLRGLLPLVFLMVMCVSARAQEGRDNGTAFRTLELYPNFETVSVYARFGGDANKNNTTELLFRKAGANQWRKGHPLDRLPGGRWVGTIFWLSPNTAYEVRVRFTDPDGVTPEELSRSVKTRDDRWPKGRGKTYYVSAEKGNTGGDGSKAAPFRTIGRGAAALSPGDTLIVQKGIYREHVTVQKTGRPGRYIRIKGEKGAILDSRDPSYDIPDNKDAWTQVGEGIFTTKLSRDPTYVAVEQRRVYGFDTLDELKTLTHRRRKAVVKAIGGYWYDRRTRTLHVKLIPPANPGTKRMQIGTLSHAFTLKDSRYVILEGFEIRHYASGILLLDNVSECVVRENIIHDTNGGITMRKNGCNNNTFEDNDISQFTSMAWGSWNLCKGTRYETCCIYVNRGRGTVVRRNKVHGSFNGIVLSDWRSHLRTNWNPPMRDTDVHENELYDIGDDALEPDGSSMNLRFWKNLCYGSWHPISLAPVSVGPCYVIRDVYWAYSGGSGGLKIRCLSDMARSAGKVYLYHVTLHFNEPKVPGWRTAFKITRQTQWENFVVRNNIFRGSRGAFYDFTSPKRKLGVSLDGDCLFASEKERALVRFAGRPYPDIEAFRKIGHEARGIQADPQFVDPDNPDPRKVDLRLKRASPCIDRAIPIPNINDDFEGKGPDIGAYEYRPKK